MKAATITILAWATVFLPVFSCGSSPLYNRELSGPETEMLNEAGGALARHLAYAPEHPEWREAPSDSLKREILNLAQRVPSAWSVFYRAASDTLMILGTPY